MTVSGVQLCHAPAAAPPICGIFSASEPWSGAAAMALGPRDGHALAGLGPLGGLPTAPLKCEDYRGGFGEKYGIGFDTNPDAR
jgi:hypothetical protein